MSTASDEPGTTLAVVVARLDDLRTDVASMRREVREAGASMVGRGEWGQRNAHVDTRLGTLGREVGELRRDVESRRAPWWSTLAVTLAGAGFLWSVLGDAIRGT